MSRAVAGGVLARPAHGAGADLDAEHALEARRRREPQQAAAAVGVDQEARAAGLRFRATWATSRGSRNGLFWKKSPGQEPQAQVADLLGDHVARSRRSRPTTPRAPAASRRAGNPTSAPAPPRAARRGARSRPASRSGRPRRRWSARRPALQKADGRLAVGARAREVRRQLRSVAVGRGAGDAGARPPSASARERRAHVVGLQRQLVVVGEVLVLAAAAGSEERTDGGNPWCRGGGVGESRGLSGHGGEDSSLRARFAPCPALRYDRRRHGRSARGVPPVPDGGEAGVGAHAARLPSRPRRAARPRHGRSGTRPTLDELDVVVCRSYLASLHGANDAVTIGRKLSSLRAFFRLAVRRRLVAQQPGRGAARAQARQAPADVPGQGGRRPPARRRARRGPTPARAARAASARCSR